MSSIDHPSNTINSIILTEQSVAPTTPPAGKQQLYVSASGLSLVNSSGCVVSAGGGGNSSYNNVYSSPPSSPTSGDLWLPSDGVSIYRYDGSIWIPYGPSILQKTPDLTGYSWVNQTTATLTSGSGGVYMTCEAGTGYDIKMYVKTIPVANNYTYTVQFIPTMQMVDYAFAGLCVRDSTSGKFYTYGISVSTGFPRVSSISFNSPTAAVADLFKYNYGYYSTPGGCLFRIRDNGTTRYFELSYDGIHFYTVYSHARTTFITPDQYGISVSTLLSNTPVKCFYTSIKES